LLENFGGKLLRILKVREWSNQLSALMSPLQISKTNFPSRPLHS